MISTLRTKRQTDNILKYVLANGFVLQTMAWMKQTDKRRNRRSGSAALLACGTPI